jgi:hypothetical protein
MRTESARSRNGFRETQEIGGRSLESGRGDEASQPLSAGDQPLADQNLDCARDREAADAESFGQLQLAIDPFARRFAGDVTTKAVDWLQIQRTVG